MSCKSTFDVDNLNCFCAVVVCSSISCCQCSSKICVPHSIAGTSPMYLWQVGSLTDRIWLSLSLQVLKLHTSSFQKLSLDAF
jgi:hypothetical protein